MALPSSLLKEFASITNDQKSTDKNTSAYGVIIKSGDDAFVQLDGTEELTPVSFAMDAEDGDRVKIEVDKHTASVIGNITSPASARTATNYIKLTEDGLIVGNLDKSGRPTGTYSLIAPGTYYIVAENGAILASFSSNNITLGGGMAVFSTEKITLGNGMAVFSTNEIKLGNGMAVFGTESVTLNNGSAVFSAQEINLGEGKVVIKPKEITLGQNGEAKFTSELISLAKGAATFSPTQITLANGMATITGDKVSLGNGIAEFSSNSIKLGSDMVKIGLTEISLGDGMAVFATDKVTLGRDAAVITMDKISLAEGKAVFSSKEINLEEGMGVFTPEKITLAKGAGVFSSEEISLGNGKALITSDKISLGNKKVEISSDKISIANGMAEFSDRNIILGGGSAEITTEAITLANGAAVFNKSSISLMNGAAIINSGEISLANGEAYFSSSTLKLGNSSSATIKLCGDKGFIKTDGDTLLLQATTAVGLRTVSGDHAADIVSKSTASECQAAIQAYDDKGLACSVIAKLTTGINLNVPSGRKVTINGYEALHNHNLFADGSISASVKLPHGKKVKLSKIVTVPDEYYLAGIRQITIDHSLKCKLVGFFIDPGDKKIGVDVVNTSDSDIEKFTVHIEYFSLRFLGTVSTTDIVTTWDLEELTDE